jgi:hypothetical protein
MKVMEDELYAVLPYGTLAIPLKLLEDLYKCSFFIDKNYDSAAGKYVYKVADKTSYDISVIPSDILTAALVAQKME